MADLLLSAQLAPGLAALAAFLAVIAFGLLVIDRAARRARLRSAVGIGRKGRMLITETGPARRWRSDLIGAMRAGAGKANLLRARQASAVRARLIRAGWRNRDALVIYVFAKIALPLIGIGGTAFFVFVVRPLSYPLLIQIAIVLGGALAASMLPDILVKNVEQRRRQEIQRALPDALDLMLICAEAGLSLDAALARVAREMVRGSPPLADEIGYTVLELRFLPDRRRALQHLGERVDLPAIRALTSTLIQGERYGTPLSQALRVLSSEQRTERMLRAEAKAARLPAVMTVPLIVFILPALFVVLLGPAALSIIDGLPGR